MPAASCALYVELGSVLQFAIQTCARLLVPSVTARDFSCASYACPRFNVRLWVHPGWMPSELRSGLQVHIPNLLVSTAAA